MRPYHIVISGYSSFDYMLKLRSPAVVGKTSLISNASCSTPHWGGCSVNIAVALARLGLNPLTILRVGDDFASSGFKAFLENEGVSAEAITQVPGEANPCCFLLQDPLGEHITTFYTGAMDGKYAEAYPDSWFLNSQAALMTVASNEDNLEFLNQVIKHQIPLFFGMKGDSSAFPPDFLRKTFRESSVIFMNETESRDIEKELKLTSITDLLKDSKTQVLVITKGAKGSTYITKDGSGGDVPAVRIEEVVDTTGGGDGFISGFLYGYFHGLDYAECCHYGALVSSFVLEAEGCTTNLPSEKQLLERKNREV